MMNTCDDHMGIITKMYSKNVKLTTGGASAMVAIASQMIP
jgi:hypothetical protein